MNDTIFNQIITTLNGLACLKGSDGTTRVYEYINATPDGFPSVGVTYLKTSSRIVDSARDMVTYRYLIRLEQEKISESFGTQKAEKITRLREYEISSLFRGKNRLEIADVIRITPLEVNKSYSDNNTRIALDFYIEVETIENITE